MIFWILCLLCLIPLVKVHEFVIKGEKIVDDPEIARFIIDKGKKPKTAIDPHINLHT